MTVFTAPAELTQDREHRREYERVITGPDGVTHAVDPANATHTRCGQEIDQRRHLFPRALICPDCIASHVESDTATAP